VRTRALQIHTAHTPQSLAAGVRHQGGLVLLESAGWWAGPGRFSFVAAAPQQVFRSRGACCEVIRDGGARVTFGNPWRVLDRLLDRHDLADEADLPFPAGFCAGFWGYELRQFIEPKLRPHPVADLDFPDCWLGFYDSLVVFDHETGGAWIISTGLQPDGSRLPGRLEERLDFWWRLLETPPSPTKGIILLDTPPALETMDRQAYVERVRRAQRYIRQGDIYQVNLAQRWTVRPGLEAWNLYQALTRRSPAPFAAFLEGDDFALASASPELFLRLDGLTVRTRPIKGTRPRGADPAADAALAEELRASAKERAELTMITDLLRNDLGKVCACGSVRVPELMRLEIFSHVQHLVSTVEGRLRAGVTHLQALEACFPGGSITGAPKFRALQLIDEFEPVGRGPFTGCLGYLGFNRQSQLAMTIRTAFCRPEVTGYYAGAGIVADSDPEAEYAETLAKARGFLDCLDNRGAGADSLAVADLLGRLFKEETEVRAWSFT
jgi:para-aminobenzoate synthetase component 1